MSNQRGEQMAEWKQVSIELLEKVTIQTDEMSTNEGRIVRTIVLDNRTKQITTVNTIFIPRMEGVFVRSAESTRR